MKIAHSDIGGYSADQITSIAATVANGQSTGIPELTQQLASPAQSFAFRGPQNTSPRI